MDGATKSAQAGLSSSPRASSAQAQPTERLFSGLALWVILFSNGRCIGHQTLELFHTELYCCSSWRAQLNSDIVYVGVWDALKRQISRLPEAGSPWWWFSLTLTLPEESLCVLFYGTRRMTAQSFTAHTRYILNSGEILDRVYFAYFVNQCIKIDKIFSRAIWGEWLWFFAGFQLPSLYSFVALSKSLQVVAVPGLLSPVPDGCLATLISFVLFCQKIFLYCTIRIFVFMFMDDLKCSFYVCVRAQQILCGSIKSRSNNYGTLKPYLAKLQAIMPPPRHKGTSESWRKAQRTQRMCRA